jgi:hypothetical protein
MSRDTKAAFKLLPVLYDQPLELVEGLGSLAPGPNRGQGLLLRPLALIQSPLAPSSTVYVVSLVPDGGVCVLALVRVLYGRTASGPEAIRPDKGITLIHPLRLDVAVSARGRTYSFPLLKCDADSVVLVDGVPLA